MVSPGSKDAKEDLRKAASAPEAQALADQDLLPADQAQVLHEVGSIFALQKESVASTFSHIMGVASRVLSLLPVGHCF